MSRRVLALLLIVGFGYSAMATAREYRALLEQSAAAGPSATVDAYFEPVGIADSELLRRALKDAGWASAAEIAMVIDPSFYTPSQRNQLFFATSYLLYPARVSLKTPDDMRDARFRGQSHRIIAAGPSNPLPGATIRELSPMLRLVSVP